MEDEVDLVVVGGGPAGSVAAAVAARGGMRVRLIEAARHPREHVGESLLPGIIPMLQEIGVLDAVENAGFVRKTGALYRGWGHAKEWDLWFEETDAYDHAWLVDRRRFDELLIDAARASGVEVVEEAAVRELVWRDDRLVGVRWARRGEPTVRTTHARQTVDASGQAALVARALGTREVIEGLKHRALWAHFEGAGGLPPPREGQALLSAQPSHWIWVFPIGGGKTSVGVVQLESAGDGRASPERSFDDAIYAAPDVRAVLGRDACRVSPVHVERDWSYQVERVAGPGFLLAGDAAGFINPILSTGVMLAVHAGWHSGRTAFAVHSGAEEETRAYAAYQSHHQKLFGDLLRMVRFFYEQNVTKEDYFWESKRILATPETALRPQKAFLILTSGLVRNLAFDERRTVAEKRRAGRSQLAGTSLETGAEPDELGFVCIHMLHASPRGPAALYFLIEPLEPSEPTLFRTLNWHLNCLAPKYDNNPIREPDVAPHLARLHDRIRELDVVPNDPLAQFWRRNRAAIAEVVSSFPDDFALVRVFGQ